jgi:flagellar L-ring protein precursor FlgH
MTAMKYISNDFIARLLFMVMVGTGVAGCSVVPQKTVDYRPVIPPDLSPPPQTTGAIYQSGYEQRLFEDIKARRVGDILIVNFDEKTAATKNAKTNTDKGSEVNTNVTEFLGSFPQFNVPGLIPLASNNNNTLDNDFDSSINFDSDAGSSQSNSLSGNIAVTVIQVYPNGYLFVSGEKRLTLNQGDEYVQLSGIVRPVDITSNNVIASSKIADARIAYSGEGVLNDANRMGWLTRVFNSPYWPF